MAYVIKNPFGYEGESVGAGDVAKKVIKKTVGVEPCEPCEERRKRMNRWLQFEGTRRRRR